MGCASAPLTAPEMTADWKIQQGQAVWKPRGGSGIAGELLVATNKSGDFVVEFSKPPITIATARRSGKQWQLEFPAERKSYRGRGAGPSRVVWLRLPMALAGGESGWKVSTNTMGWRLERGKESLEGFLAP
jgi:hypothetical protein